MMMRQDLPTAVVTGASDDIDTATAFTSALPGFQQGQQQTATPGIRPLRALDGNEELLWIIEGSACSSPSILAEIEGPTTLEDWKRATNAVQRRYPTLSTRIRKIPGKRPFFELAEGPTLPIKVIPFPDGSTAAERAEALINSEVNFSFRQGEQGLARLVIAHCPQRTILFFSGHHSVFDGLGNVSLMSDLIAAASGETLGEPLPFERSLGDLLGMGISPDNYEKGLTEPLRQIPPPDKYAPASIRTAALATSRLQALVVRAKAEGSTIYGALMAAVLLAGRSLHSQWRERPVNVVSAIDMKRILDMPPTSGMLINTHFTPVVLSGNLDFWTLAKQFTQEIRAVRTLDAARAPVAWMRGIVAQEFDPYVETSLPFPEYDLLLSSYGKGMRSEYGSLRLEAVYPSVVPFRGSLQMVSAITVDEKLFLTHASREPHTSILEHIVSLLCQASGTPAP
jgi:hypothetical protein